MPATVRLAAGPFDPAEELRSLVAAAEGAGGVASFVGLARGCSSAGEPIDRLVLEHHPRITIKSLEATAAAALSRFRIDHVSIVHRFGAILPGEPIVFAGAAAAHRRAAFEAADYAMDRLKTEAVFWKREETEGGRVWVEPTEADYADRERWG